MITVTPVPGRPRHFENEEHARAFIAGLPESYGFIMVDPDRVLDGLDPVIEQRASAPPEEEG